MLDIMKRKMFNFQKQEKTAPEIKQYQKEWRAKKTRVVCDLDNEKDWSLICMIDQAIQEGHTKSELVKKALYAYFENI